MELLVRIVDKARSGDARIDAQRTTAGDVICYQPDGHRWGVQELHNPEWRILRVPGMSKAEAEALIGRELPTAFGGVRLLRKRQSRIDLAALDADEGGAVLAPRAARRHGVDAVVRHANVRARTALKPANYDPRVIGPRREIG